MSKHTNPLAIVLGECITRMLYKKPVEPDEPIIPDTPTTAMYLYGTPNESGNIGLRSGDTVTMYDGAVLPDISTVYTDEVKAIYPNVVMANVSKYSNYRLFACSDVSKHRIVDAQLSSGERTDFYWGEGCRYIVSEFDENNGTWGGFGEEVICTNSYNFSYPMWANFNLMYENGTMYMEESDPIQVGEIVDYINDIPIYDTKE